jgi:malate dehydrogenase (oxaloacetate-decarboxylating)(NADP+)
MRAVFVDASPTLAAVMERLHRPDDPAMTVHRTPNVTPPELPAALDGAEIAVIDHTALPTPIARQCTGLKHVVFLGTGARSYMSPEELAEITTMAAEEMMRFGLKPKAALLSHSNFGTSNEPSALKMRKTLDLLRVQAPWLEVDGEMHGDVALDSKQRAVVMPHSALAGDANLLVFPNIDADNISYNLLKTAAGGNIAIGPVLLGAAKPVHILTASATVRRIVNMSALTVADANAER